MAVTLTNKYHDLHCKVCGGDSHILGVKDFNRSCEEEKGRRVFPPMGHAVYYHQCEGCGFIFSVDFDDWTVDDFLTNIYNDQYLKVDPVYGG